jgi:ADP-heptose:LPS heptosyltransferase
MAAAVGTPVVSLFAGTHNIPERFRPYTSTGIVIHHPTSMDGIAPDAVVDAAKMLVEKQ